MNDYTFIEQNIFYKCLNDALIEYQENLKRSHTRRDLLRRTTRRITIRREFVNIRLS